MPGHPNTNLCGHQLATSQQVLWAFSSSVSAHQCARDRVSVRMGAWVTAYPVPVGRQSSFLACLSNLGLELAAFVRSLREPPSFQTVKGQCRWASGYHTYAGKTWGSGSPFLVSSKLTGRQNTQATCAETESVSRFFLEGCPAAFCCGCKPLPPSPTCVCTGGCWGHRQRTVQSPDCKC